MSTLMELQRHDRRRLRAQPLLHALMEKVRPYLRDERDLRYIFSELDQAMREAGVELLTDVIRSDLGLPPRGPDGWTDEEIRALETARLDAITRPIFLPISMAPEELKR